MYQFNEEWYRTRGRVKKLRTESGSFLVCMNEKKISKQISDMYRKPLVIKHKVKRVTNLNAEFMIFF